MIKAYFHLALYIGFVSVELLLRKATGRSWETL